MTIVVNGVPREVERGWSVVDLLTELQLDSARRGIAVARNGGVVLRASWPDTLLEDGDRLEVLHAVQGG